MDLDTDTAALMVPAAIDGTGTARTITDAIGAILPTLRNHLRPRHRHPANHTSQSPEPPRPRSFASRRSSAFTESEVTHAFLAQHSVGVWNRRGDWSSRPRSTSVLRVGLRLQPRLVRTWTVRASRTVVVIAARAGASTGCARTGSSCAGAWLFAADSVRRPGTTDSIAAAAQ